MQHFNSQCDYITLAKQYGTPLYIYDIDSIQTQYFNIKNSFGGFKSLVCYALKANSNLSVVKSLAHCGSGADCVSLNEVKRALLAGIPSYKIIEYKCTGIKKGVPPYSNLLLTLNLIL